jgi:hypothetical protein
MKNAVCLADEFLHQLGVENRVNDQSKPFRAFEMRDVLVTPRRKVVNNRDLVRFVKKFVGEMRADKTRAAGN